MQMVTVGDLVPTLRHEGLTSPKTPKWHRRPQRPGNGIRTFPAGTMKEAAMSDDFFDRFAVLGEEPVGAGAAVDQGWLTKGLEANKVQSSLDVVLTFVDGARKGTNITDATLNGVVRAMFDEQQSARDLRAELSRDSDIRTEPTVGSKPIDRLDRDG